MTQNFSKGEYVLYGKTGVCLIEDIKECGFLKKGEMYYILKPIGNRGSTVYVPVKNSSLTSDMHRLMTKEEIDGLLLNAGNREIEWIEQKNERADYFNDIISEGDRGKIVLLIRCICMKKREKQREKKHLCASDESILKTAERLIDEEFSHVLGCPEDKVVDYIREKIGAAE